jgi:predicted metalloprotease with PDZ domain
MKKKNYMTQKISYTITSNDLSAHLFHVSVTVNQPDELGQILSLPVWIPGSYMVREFARNVVQIRAHCDGKKVALKKLDKASWQAAPCKGALTIDYEVYAWDLSVRAAHLDQTHGFFNGTSVFLKLHGQENAAHIVDIQRPKEDASQTWRVATSLPLLKAKLYGFGTYIAENYDALIDHPVEMGNFLMASFEAHGVPHDFVVTGRVPNVDMNRIVVDVKKICEAQIAFFEPRSKQAPMDRYVFMTMLTDEGRGGLEHRASTALIFPRSELPTKNDDSMSDGYADFLGLCSHEYFHTWNVKRIKPAAFANYDLTQENYTSLLWVFEGFTSYYDDLFLRRLNLIDEPLYLQHISKSINSLLRGSGRRKQSVVDSSFDAWTKYYRQDENAPNAITSYYVKGSLIALGLDLFIRSETEGKKSLDDVMRYLWKTFGSNFYTKALEGKQQGVDEDGMVAIIENSTGVNAKKFIDKYVLGTEELPLEKWFADFGIDMQPNGKKQKASLGVKVSSSGSECKVVNVFEGKAAHKAGLSAGDQIIAVNGLRVHPMKVNLAQSLAAYSVGEKVEIHAFRREELMTFTAKLQADDMPNWRVQLIDNPKAKLFAKRPSK